MSFERVTWCFVTTSLFLKYGTIPGGSFLFVMTMTLLSGAYMFFSIPMFLKLSPREMFRAVSYAETPLSIILLVIFCGFALSTIMMGILFILQNWIGGMFILIAGLTSLSMVEMIAHTASTDIKRNYRALLWPRSFLIGILGIACPIISEMVN